jgi:hypothetical protein
MEEKKSSKVKTVKEETTTAAGLKEEDTEMIIESSEDLEVVKSFDDIGLREELLRGNTTLHS